MVKTIVRDAADAFEAADRTATARSQRRLARAARPHEDRYGRRAIRKRRAACDARSLFDTVVRKVARQIHMLRDLSV